MAERRCWWHDSVVKGGVCRLRGGLSDGPPKAGFCRWHKKTSGWRWRKCSAGGGGGREGDIGQGGEGWGEIS